MNTFTTTVEGGTLAEVEEAAKAEVSRFFAGYDSMTDVYKSRQTVFYISPHAFVRKGDGSVASITYQAEVTVTW
jgi:hypothetical protein